MQSRIITAAACGLSASIIVGVAVADCLLPTPTPPGSTENPCVTGVGGSCASYISCPGNDTCSPAACGWTACATQGIANMPCRYVLGGTFNSSTLCCEGGILGTYTGTYSAVTFLKESGISCGWCMPGGGGDE